MLSKGWSNEIPAALCERNDTNPPVFAALYPADQALGEEAVHRDTDRTWCPLPASRMSPGLLIFVFLVKYGQITRSDVRNRPWP